MSVKSELMKSLKLAIESYEFGDEAIPVEAEQYALWAAKWMAERCAKEAESSVVETRLYGYNKEIAASIRQLAKELSQ